MAYIPPQQRDIAAGSYFCLLLRSRVRARGTPEEPDHPRHKEIFLIPEPVGPKSDATYRRIGLGKLSGKAPSFDHSQSVVLQLV